MVIKASKNIFTTLLIKTVSGSMAQTDRYSEFIHTGSLAQGYRPCDLSGNILTLNRFGMKSPNNSLDLIDQLNYTYEGNQLKAVDDVVTTNNGGDFMDNGHTYTNGGPAEYTYDANGNLTSDINKGIISISYNTLNLPVAINRTNSIRVVYLYDATGTKRQQKNYINIGMLLGRTS